MSSAILALSTLADIRKDIAVINPISPTASWTKVLARLDTVASTIPSTYPIRVVPRPLCWKTFPQKVDYERHAPDEEKLTTLTMDSFLGYTRVSAINMGLIASGPPVTFEGSAQRRRMVAEGASPEDIKTARDAFYEATPWHCAAFVGLPPGRNNVSLRLSPGLTVLLIIGTASHL